MRTCKTCHYSFHDSESYCPNCGNKWVDKRPTIKGTFFEFIFPLFNWDHRFFVTIWHLIKQPQTVFAAYIGGARNKYFQPFSFLLITLSFLIVVLNIFPVDYAKTVQFNVHKTEDATTQDLAKVELVQKKIGENINYIFSNYYNIITLIGIPFYALTSLFIFWKKKNNFAEHLIFQAYINGFLSLTGSAILRICFGLNDWNIQYESFLTIAFSFLFTNYCFIKFYQLNLKQTIFANLKFVPISMLVLGIYFLLIGLTVSIYTSFTISDQI